MGTNIQPTNPENFARLKCSPSTIVCREKTVILGDVTIGPDCVIHPTANIVASGGPIIIGGNNLFEERVKIINNSNETMVIGDHNVFEVDSHCEARKVGNNNLMECKSYAGFDIQITDNCIIGAGCRLAASSKGDNIGPNGQEELDVLEPNTVITGRELNRRVVQSLPASSHTSQLDFLRKILPNYQKLWRPGNLPLTPQQGR